jgi:hypothetical protein
MELYGLVSIVDTQVFGDAMSFRLQHVQTNNETQRNLVLREGLNPLCKRTSRKQVQEYVHFTRRIPITQDFFPVRQRTEALRCVSEYLRRDELMALPTAQRQLITLVLRKLLASSSFAISGTLRNLAQRLQTELDGTQHPGDAAEAAADFDSIDELIEEWEPEAEAEQPPPDDNADLTEIRNRKIKSENPRASGLRQARGKHSSQLEGASSFSKG